MATKVTKQQLLTDGLPQTVCLDGTTSKLLPTDKAVWGLEPGWLITLDGDAYEVDEVILKHKGPGQSKPGPAAILATDGKARPVLYQSGKRLQLRQGRDVYQIGTLVIAAKQGANDLVAVETQAERDARDRARLLEALGTAGTTADINGHRWGTIGSSTVQAPGLRRERVTLCVYVRNASGKLATVYATDEGLWLVDGNATKRTEIKSLKVKGGAK